MGRVCVHHFFGGHKGRGARLDKCQMKDVAKKLSCSALVGEFALCVSAERRGKKGERRLEFPREYTVHTQEGNIVK